MEQSAMEHILSAMEHVLSAMEQFFQHWNSSLNNGTIISVMKILSVMEQFSR